MVNPKFTFLFTLLLLSQCSDSPSGPEPTSGPLVSEPEVWVSGVRVEGVVSEGTGASALFRIRASSPDGVRRVVMEYQQPGPNQHGGPMMGGYRGTVLCYDDGTHGDDVPADGVYHYMDPRNEIGCHGIGVPAGEYRYTFWCEDVHGTRSNEASITLVRR